MYDDPDEYADRGEFDAQFDDPYERYAHETDGLADRPEDDEEPAG